MSMESVEVGNNISKGILEDQIVIPDEDIMDERNDADHVQQDDLVESQQTSIDQENYFVWKRNAPFLYDYLQTSALLWPSLTVQFFPDVEKQDDRTLGYRLLTGTYTSGSMPEYLTIMQLQVKNQINVSIDDFNVDKKEFTSMKNLPNKISDIQKISHDQEINRARYNWSNPDIIATINGLGKVCIYDRTKHPSQPSINIKPEIILDYHKADGFAIGWNFNDELLTAASNGLIYVYDLNKWSKDKQILEPSNVVVAHDNGVNDASFLFKNNSIFGSVGEDKQYKIWDKRNSTSNHILSYSHETSPINSLAFNPVNQYLSAIGDAEGNILIHDLRNFDKPIRKIEKAHSSSITCLEWNYNKPTVLASGSEDNLVKLWNVSEEYDNLIFVHGGHLYGINDLSWNPNDDWMISSVSNDNSLHVWKPSF
ncbi:hypothetical protein PACTADRAFT_50458 [Pachysolen tannophilus NRRL Y-2460]|uniref:Histone-binding protein RBBP4-like N-terminal domain-containing protein n=1 Tax=Pachysolen tannophilus NRRL Y-2460 TaxID=669874 RepID=A0A1E4TS62_PACTA|nr:hypothetical protein PACTADRAFT_50458 [Pachysolen tannophilus NRRL Y-2460]